MRDRRAGVSMPLGVAIGEVARNDRQIQGSAAVSNKVGQCSPQKIFQSLDVFMTKRVDTYSASIREITALTTTTDKLSESVLFTSA